jgi:hypothetical protein
MSFEQSIDQLTAAVKALSAAVEAHTGVLVAHGGAAGKPAAAPPPASRASGKGKAAAPAPAPAPAPAAEDGGLGDDGFGDDDDGGLGGDDTATEAISAEDAKAVVLAYRDKAVKTKGREEGLNLARSLMKKHVQAIDDIDAKNAAEIHKAFTAALAKLG